MIKKKHLIGCFAILLIKMSVLLLLSLSSGASLKPNWSQSHKTLWKTGPRMRGLAIFFTLLRNNERNLKNLWTFYGPLRLVWLYGTALVSFSIMATSDSSWTSLTLDCHMKSCIVQTCLCSLVKLLDKLYPNKRLSHPLKRGVWLTMLIHLQSRHDHDEMFKFSDWHPVSVECRGQWSLFFWLRFAD